MPAHVRRVRRPRARHAAPRTSPVARAAGAAVGTALVVGAALAASTAPAPLPSPGASTSAAGATAYGTGAVALPARLSNAAAAVPTVVAAPERASRAERRPEAVRPVDGPVTSSYGRRWGRLHAGTDFGVPVGTPVRAVADGVVQQVEHAAGGYGTSVRLLHPDGTVSLYAHLSESLVRSGAVLAGDEIARSGDTGRSTGPHLHLELRASDDVPFDAAPWFQARGVGL